MSLVRFNTHRRSWHCLRKTEPEAPGLSPTQVNISASGDLHGYRPARFQFHCASAKRVFLAGSFNHWNPLSTPLVDLGHGLWLRLLWLPAERHEYLFVADNLWLLDPEADDYVPNVYGTMNAVVNLGSAARQTTRA